MLNYTELFTWGGDQFRQAGSESSRVCMPRFCTYNILISSVCCGEDHAGFISRSGHVYTMGSNSDGRLGIGDVSVSWSSSPCLVESLLSLKSIQISCGGSHTALVTENGSLYTWGGNVSGALGLGDNTPRSRPHKVPIDSVRHVSCGSRHTGAVCQQSIKMWGDGELGQLGNGRRQFELSPVDIGLANGVSVACGLAHTLFLTKEGLVYATGDNSGGQLGTANKRRSLIPTRVEGLHRTRQIACGSHSACISKHGELFVWGTGVFGECLVPAKLNSFKVKDCSVGNGFAAIIDSKQNVWTWGGNHSGELGLGDFTARESPALVNKLRGKTVRTVACGSNFVIALGSDINPTVSMTDRNERSRSIGKNMTQTEMMTSRLRRHSKVSSKDCFFQLEQALEGSAAARALEGIARKYDKVQYYYQRERRRVEDLGKEVQTLKQLTNDQDKVIENYKAEDRKTEKEINKLKQNYEQELDRLRQQILMLKAGMDEATKEKNRYSEAYKHEYELRMNLESEIREMKQVSLQETFTTTLQEKDNPFQSFLLEETLYTDKENFKHKSVERYQASPVESQISHHEPKDDSEFYHLRMSKSASELVRMTDSPFDAFFSPSILKESQNSPSFLMRGNTPPTFRDNGLTDSQGNVKNSLTEIRALQEIKNRIAYLDNTIR